MPNVQKSILVVVAFVLAIFLTVYLFAYRGLNGTIEDKIASKKPIALFFSASWCGSCNKQKPILYEVLKEHENLEFYEIGSNLNKIRKKILFEQYKVQGIPTLLLFNDGKEIVRLRGLQPKETLEKAFLGLK
jgi:thioredoxin 1